MTILSQLRQFGTRLGVDVRRVHETAPARLEYLLRRRGVDLVLDVGANRGDFARQLRRVGFRGEIASFEPLPGAFRVLARAVSADDAWTAHQIALGDADERATLNIAGNDGASSSLLPMLRRHERASPEARYVGTVEIEMRRLTTIWVDLTRQATAPFMKLDVQGFEDRVLDGAADCLDQLVGIQLEVSLVPVYEGAPTLRGMLDRMEKAGLALVGLEPGFTDPATGELLQFDGVFMRPTGG